MVYVRHDCGRSNSMRKRYALSLLSVVAAGSLWIAFVATSNPHEMLVGLLCVAVTYAFSDFVCRSAATELAFRLRDVLAFWRMPWYILSGIGEITLVLAKDLLRIAPAKNLYRVCGFDASAHDPLRMARAVMAIAYTTVAPNFIVLGIDPATSRMLFHQLAASSVPKMTKALGARG
jgi:hypothetical protein